MVVEIRGKNDETLAAIADVLGDYQSRHPNADIRLYRQNSVAVRIRIIDPDFAGVSRAERDDIVWRVLERLPEESQGQITVLLLLTPDETTKSFANMEFEHPIPSRL